MSAVYDNWERLVEATLRREDLRITAQRTPSELSLASSSSFNNITGISHFNSPVLPVGQSFSYQQILQATDRLSGTNMINYHLYGCLYYGVLEDGIQVVVKESYLSSAWKESLLVSELEFLSKVSHSRFVPLLGHCLENRDKKFLVYKYMANRDLAFSGSSLDWSTRLKIAIGVAERPSNATCAYDVYCFGKVLLELVTGKLGSNAGNNYSKRDWTENALAYITIYDKELLLHIMDLSVVLDDHLFNEVWAVANVAKACLSPKPSERPQMTYILEALSSCHFSAVSDGKEVYLNGEDVEPSNLKIFSFSELKAATRNFASEELLREGGFGRVYKGWIPDKSTSNSSSGFPIAVERFKDFKNGSCWGNKERTEINMLGRLSHPNLIKLLGSCWDNRELILDYESMPKGSLDNHLFTRGPAVLALPWDVRLKILIGAARGLAYLNAAKRSVLLRGVQSSNILLDDAYNAKISDFGLAMDPLDVTLDMGTYGCAGPEYIAAGHLYAKSDVYGFGVVLAEMLTGLRALDNSRLNGRQNLVDWIKPQLSDKSRIKSIMDYRLEGKYSTKAAVRLAELAAMCLNSSLELRPSMKQVADELENI